MAAQAPIGRSASTRRSTPGSRRAAIRYAHLALGVPVATLVYAPADVVEPIRLAVQVLMLPALVGTGLWMWLGPQWRRRARRRSRTAT
ncbi:MAG: hypothetical protein ACRCZD_08690 [Phycicoccus sp.]